MTDKSLTTPIVISLVDKFIYYSFCQDQDFHLTSKFQGKNTVHIMI